MDVKWPESVPPRDGESVPHWDGESVPHWDSLSPPGRGVCPPWDGESVPPGTGNPVLPSPLGSISTPFHNK